MLQRKRAQKTKIQQCVLRGMIRGKSQGSLPKAEGVIIFYTPRNKPALGLVVHGVTRHHPWRMCWAPCMELKTLGSSHGVLLGGQHRCEGHRCEQRCEQHRCEGSVPLGGAEALGSPLGIRAGVPGQCCKQGLSADTSTLHTAHCPLRAALFPCQPSRFVSGRSLPTNQEWAITSGHFQSHFSDPHQHFKTRLNMQLAPLHCQF